MARLAKKGKGSVKILFRVDAEPSYGLGHLFKCLNLAKEFKKNWNTKILFAVKDNQETVKIASKFFTVKKLSFESEKRRKQLAEIKKEFMPDIVIEDVRNANKAVLKRLKTMAKMLVGLDDVHAIELCCDVVVSGWVSRKVSAKGRTKKLLGPKYLIMSEIFSKLNKKNKKIAKEGNNIVICMGGSDPKNLSLKTVKALETIDNKIKPIIVLGPLYQQKKGLQKELKKAKRKYKLLENISNEEMAELLAKSDLGILASGGLVYEAAAVGLPTIALSEVEHQVRNARYLKKFGSIIDLGKGWLLKKEKLAKTAKALIESRNKRQNMSQNGKRLVDGLGTKRIAEQIAKEFNAKRTKK